MIQEATIKHGWEVRVLQPIQMIIIRSTSNCRRGHGKSCSRFGVAPSYPQTACHMGWDPYYIRVSPRQTSPSNRSLGYLCMLKFAGIRYVNGDHDSLSGWVGPSLLTALPWVVDCLNWSLVFRAPCSNSQLLVKRVNTNMYGVLLMVLVLPVSTC